MFSSKDGKMIILSSPSGAGKTTLVKKISKQKNYKISISHTTREPRANEIDGVDYFFISENDFQKLIKKNAFLEYANVFKNLYGSTKDQVFNNLENGHNVLFDIDWQGTKQLKKIKDLSIVTFFIIPPNLKILKERLLNRHEGQEKLVEERMNKFNEELSHWNEYDYVLVNDNLEICYNQILDLIIKSKKGEKQDQDLEKLEKNIKDLSK